MKQVQILRQEIVYEYPHIRFRVEQTELQHERQNGEMSPPITRLSLERGDGAAVILYNPKDQTVVLIEQFRYPTYQHGTGWLLELPAGIVNPTEDPADTMRRELIEETGFHIATLRLVSTFYTSPGGSSERIFLYYGEFSPEDKLSAGGGLPSEHEDIQLHILPATQAFEELAQGKIQDAKTIIGLQWLQMKV